MTKSKIGDTLNETKMRQLYVDLQPGDTVEVVHHIKIGFKEHSTHTVGVVVKKERRRSGMDGGFARHWDDKYWFDHLTLRKDDGELTAVTMDEYTELRKLEKDLRKYRIHAGQKEDLSLAGEETHCREFRGFLAGYER